LKKLGRFITFEGGDGAGKTTLIESVYLHLACLGANVLKTRAPGGTEAGQEIRQVILTPRSGGLSKRCELLLYLADRAEHVEAFIRPALKNNKIVLCDRYNDSTLVYQGAARGFDEKWLRKLLSFATDDLTPDLTFYLDVDPAIGVARTLRSRGAKDRLEAESLAFHRKVRLAYRAIAKKEPKRVQIIDASLPPDEVFEQVKRRIDAFLYPRRK